MTDILLIRHGENEYTRKGKLAGWTPGVHLNETGRAQAEALAERLAQAPIKAIYSSPLERALETAGPLAQARKLPVQKCEGIGEVRYGEWTGRSLKVLARTKLWKVVQRQPSAMEFPGGETIRAVQARAVEAVEEIVKRHPKDAVALFSHGDVIKLIVAYYLGMPLDTFQRVAIGTGSLTVIRVSPGMPMVMRMNEQPVAGKK
jgi:probable phosphoglycerate mutase